MTNMTTATRYTPEFKQVAVRRVEGGRNMGTAIDRIGLPESGE
jgi:transposase-like protein